MKLPQKKQSILSSLTSPIRNFLFYPALLLGGSFGLILYSYWFVDFLPPTSKQIILYTTIASLLGTIGYYFLLEFVIVPMLSQMSKTSRWGMLIGSILIGTYLSFAYLNDKGSSPRYLAFLLPSEHLTISVPAQPRISDAQIAIHGITTSLGDISYRALNYKGWERSDYNLKLTNPLNNTLEWTGRTGEQAIISFQTSLPGTVVNVSWNGENQILQLPSNGDGQYQHTRSFAVPFYASRTMLLLLGAIIFSVICWAVNLLIWKNQTAILSRLEQSISALLHPREHRSSENQ